MALFLAFASTLLCILHFAGATPADSAPYDDEDSLSSAFFSLRFDSETPNCSHWYDANVNPFYDAMTESVVASINDECGSCGFVAGNLANIIATCRTYQATIIEWDSSEVSLRDLLSAIKRRFNSSSNTFAIQFNTGSSDNLAQQVSFTPVGVAVEMSMGEGSGQGSDDDDDDAGSGNIATTPYDVTTTPYNNDTNSTTTETAMEQVNNSTATANVVTTETDDGGSAQLLVTGNGAENGDRRTVAGQPLLLAIAMTTAVMLARFELVELVH